MPNVQSLIGGEGATFRRAYVPYPLCCPSRASLLTGQYMHNHLVRGNVAAVRRLGTFLPQEANALPVRTKDAGYYNVHIGKYLNGYADRSWRRRSGAAGLGRVVREDLRGPPLLQLRR